MDPMPVVLDISSDDEPGLEEGTKIFDYDWIKEFLGEPDKESDDSDEVIIVREVKPEQKSKSSRPTVKDVDDDCVVLDGDPENRITSVNEAATGSEELLIVGEKGQIACRDYPHPRHLCVKFPFSSTPHERHCDQCHCYVCDSLAPCLKWSADISGIDHCHATDKAEMWKIQRKNFKLGKRAPLPASINYDTSPCIEHHRHNQVLPLGVVPLSANSILQSQASGPSAMHTCSSPNPVQEIQASGPTVMHAYSSSLESTIQNEVSRPNAIPVCSPTTNFTVPNGTNHGRCQDSGSTLARNRYQPHSIPRRLLGVHNNAIRRDRRHDAGSLGPQFHRSHMMSKGVSNVGATLTVSNSAHASSGRIDHVNPAQHYDRYHATTGLSNDRNCNGWDDVWPTTYLSSYPHLNPAQPSLHCVSGNIGTSKTQAFSQPLPQSNDSQDIYQSFIQGNEVTSYVACLNSNQHGNEHQIGSDNANASGNIVECGNPSQDTCQQKPLEGNQSEIARKDELSESTNLSAVGDIENWLLDKDTVPVAGDAAFPSELKIPSPDLSPIDTGILLFDYENSWNGFAHA